MRSSTVSISWGARLRKGNARALLVACAIGASHALGCVFAPPTPAGNDGRPQPDATAADLAKYDELQTTLDKGRTEFLSRSAMELSVVGNQLFWLEFASFAPTLHRYDAATKTRLDYGFSIGADGYNFRASSNLVVTAEPSTRKYTAYDASAKNAKLGETVVPGVLTGAKWWAYAADQDSTYVVKTEKPNRTELYRWRPGNEPTFVTTLEEAGAPVGEFIDFAVSGDQLIFIESGRLWTMSLSARQATWIKTKSEVGDTVSYQQDGVIFSTRAPAKLHFLKTKEALDVSISDRIEASAYRLTPSHERAHQWAQDFTRWKSWVVYIGGTGVFAFNMDTSKIAPVLLEPRAGDVTIKYRRPIALSGGMLYVTGLTSLGGSTGADGPVYAVDLTRALP
ncbi:MAG: hypothetical protein NVSMB1_22340 [Polyangiales bacterium]